MPTSLGPAEILVVLVVALIVLGPKRLPEAGRQIGKALAEVRRWSSSVQAEVRDAFEVEPDVATPEVEASSSSTPPPASPPTATHPDAAGNGAADTPPAALPPEWASPPPEPGPSR